MKYVFTLCLFFSFSLLAQTTLDVGQILDVRSGKILKAKRIYIDQNTGRITEIINIKNKNSPTYSFPQVTLIPGLIDTHTHLCLNDLSLDGGFDRELEREVRTPLSQRINWAKKHASELLRSGFTVLRDLGNCGEWGEQILSESYFRQELSPTFIYSGKGLSAPGGQFFSFSDPELVHREYLVISSESELQESIIRVKSSGATWLKLYADNDPNPQMLSKKILSKAVKIGHQLGLKVAIHAIKEEALDNAIEAHPESIEHAVELSPKQIEKIKKYGITLVMTDLSGELRKLFYTFTFDHNRQFHAFAPSHLDPRARAAQQKGVPLAFGSDYYFDLQIYGYNFGQGTLEALLGLQTQGFSPLDILRMSTINASKLLGTSATYGEISKGHQADFIGLLGNPLENLNYLRHPLFIMKNGKLLSPNR